MRFIRIVIVLLLAGYLYFWRLGEVPTGVYVDEAVTGYNAYSLLRTARDEYGKFLPIAMRFFGSYSPPLYTYLTVGSVWMFGLSAFSVRAISALSGVMMVLVAWGFLRSINLVRSKYTPIVGAILMAISPWNLFYSRTGYEIYLGFLLFSTGALFVYWALRQAKYLPLGLGLLSLSTYGAHTERYLVPLFLVVLMVVFRRELFGRERRKYLVTGLVIAGVMQIPNLYLMTTPAFFTKGEMFYSGVVMGQAEKMTRFLPFGLAIILAFVREFLSQYTTYFSPRSLFFMADSDFQRSMPELSVFYPWMVVPYMVGIWVIWRKRGDLAAKFIMLLAGVMPILPALVGDPFSTQRALPMLLPMIIVISVGVDRLILKRRLLIWLCALGVLMSGSLLLLWRSYFVLLTGERAKTWGYGYEQLAKIIEESLDSRFLIDSSRIKPPHIELLFYLKYPPEDLHSEVSAEIAQNYYTMVEFGEHYEFGNIEVRRIDWEKDPCIKQILVGDEFAVSEMQAKEHVLEMVFEIRDPVDGIVFQGYETNPDEKCGVGASSF